MRALSVESLLTLFADAERAQLGALGSLTASARRERTTRPGQYALDLVADAAVLSVLHPAGVRVLSEESGTTGEADAAIVVVVDPVDGSTNCSREIPYWGISLCALDGDGPLCALVANGATGRRWTASRDGGAVADGEALVPSSTVEIERAVVAVSGLPERPVGWRQFRALGSIALSLCDVAAGHLDGYLDGPPDQHGPWDYLGGALVCQEAGAVVADAADRPLAVSDGAARRQIVAAGTPELFAALRGAVAA